MTQNQLLGEELPSVLVNRFHVNASLMAVRIAFAEIVPGGSQTERARAVFIMSPSDAAELAAVLQKVAKELAEAVARDRKKAN